MAILGRYLAWNYKFRVWNLRDITVYNYCLLEGKKCSLQLCLPEGAEAPKPKPEAATELPCALNEPPENPPEDWDPNPDCENGPLPNAGFDESVIWKPNNRKKISNIDYA